MIYIYVYTELLIFIFFCLILSVRGAANRDWADNELTKLLCEIIIVSFFHEYGKINVKVWHSYDNIKKETKYERTIAIRRMSQLQIEVSGCSGD